MRSKGMRQIRLKHIVVLLFPWLLYNLIYVRTLRESWASLVPSFQDIEAPKTQTPNFLMGIFTTADETVRHRYIRNTMLKNHTFLCTISEYLDKTAKNCKVVYAFVIGGGDPDRAPQNKALANSTSELVSRVQGDMLYLDIAENMNGGKSPTFLRYGHLLPDIDYVAKCDSDVLMDMVQLQQLVSELPTRKSREYRPTYGGVMFGFTHCGGDEFKWCGKLQGRVYMSGEFFFMSKHLTGHVTSEWVQANVRFPHEDLETGFKVSTYTEQPITYLSFNTKQFWKHGVKKRAQWMMLWKLIQNGQGDRNKIFSTRFGTWRNDDFENYEDEGDSEYYYYEYASVGEGKRTRKVKPAVVKASGDVPDRTKTVKKFRFKAWGDGPKRTKKVKGARIDERKQLNDRRLRVDDLSDQGSTQPKMFKGKIRMSRQLWRKRSRDRVRTRK